MPTTKVSKTKRVKAGKSKKDGKQESKADKESDMEKANANAAVWELRLKVTNQSLSEYQEAHHKLTCANEQLTNQLYRAETDAIELTAHWETQLAAKEHQIRSLEKCLKAQETLARDEKNKLLGDINVGLDEIKKMKDREAELEQELTDLKKNMEITAAEHVENLHKMERKFSAEKEHLEKEMMKQCNQKIAAIVKDHREATAHLEDTLQAAFKEQDRLNEALRYHAKEAKDLHKLTNSLTKKNTSLALDKDMLELTLKKNAAQIEAQKDKLSELTSKVASLEQDLELKVEELEQQQLQEKMNLGLIQASQVELDKLQKVLIMREKELEHIKQLASLIVKRRTQLEEFFHDALTHVKQEILASRFQYKRKALQDYRLRFSEATEGKIKFPPIRTFHKSPHSTNSVYSDMDAAATW
uniref:Si:ch211-243o19.4 n=1 Tax=Gouania willdenowi TaxID=441366 RepID=A0A8C5ECK3_GOUWI